MRVEQGPAQPGATMTARGINAEAVWDMVQGKAVPRQPQLAAESREVDGDFDGLLVDWREKGHGRLRGPRSNARRRDLQADGDAQERSGPDDLPGRKDVSRSSSHRRPQPAERPPFRITIDYDNWRDLDGVKFPFDIMEERTGKEPVVTLVTYTDKIEIDVPMDDGLFAAPVK